MSFSESDPQSQPPFMQPNYDYGGDMGGMGGFWPQPNVKIDPHSQFEYEQPPAPPKRPRNWGNNQPIPNSAPPPMNPRPNPMNPPMVNKGTGRMFYKTRMCLKFMDGICRNGDSCNFAHGPDDLREPPPNWQELVAGRDKDKGPMVNGGWNDDQRNPQRKICRKFYNGEECPYGDKCNFLHEAPPKFKSEPDWSRESSVISIGTTGHGMGHRSEPVQIDVLNKQLSENSAGFGFDSRPAFRKTKMCTKWETTGYCQFGERCHFAHGPSDLRAAGSSEAGPVNVTVTSTNPIPVSAFNEVPASIVVAPPPDDEVGKKIYAKLKAGKKLDKIYADWLDGMTPPRTLPEEGQ